jgi:hypothetical protein
MNDQIRVTHSDGDREVVREERVSTTEEVSGDVSRPSRVTHSRAVIEQRDEDLVPVPMSRNQQIFKSKQVIWYILAALETLLGLRFILKIIAANPDSGFANFIYTMSSPFLAPFAGLTQTPQANGAVLEIPTLVAMLVYGLLFWFISWLVDLVWRRP